MKSRPLVFLLLLLALCGPDAEAQFRRNYAANMAVDAEVQEDFYRRYPDLRDESEIVFSAARTLARERSATRSDDETAALLAERVRAIIAQRSQKDWEVKAMSIYPELGVSGSEFNTLFLKRVREMEKASPQFMQEPSWPLLLARRVADELQGKIAKAKAAPTPAATATTAASPASAAQPARWWKTWPSLILLTVLLALPARWLLRCSRAFAGADGSPILWQRALQPTAWAYLVVALIAMGRTFAANGDLGLLDRFGITLLVSLLTGAVFALVAYVLSIGALWWWQHRTVSTLRRLEAQPAEVAGRKV